jgi:putative membrane protein
MADRQSGSNRDYQMLFGLWILGLVLSGFRPTDRLTWLLEIFPVVVAIPVLYSTRESFPLPRYILVFVFIHGIVLMIGGHYTYAGAPPGRWLAELFGLQRNPYDRIGHLFQGFVPALIAAEILQRKVGLKSAGWIFFLSVAVCMAISMVYEFIEWWTALILGQNADAFLGTQGDPWDTQWDMFSATAGAVLGQAFYWTRQWRARSKSSIEPTIRAGVGHDQLRRNDERPVS